jgi:hypothetical protein
MAGLKGSLKGIFDWGRWGIGGIDDRRFAIDDGNYILGGTNVVIPAKAGIHAVLLMDWLRRCLQRSRFRGNDNQGYMIIIEPWSPQVYSCLDDWRRIFDWGARGLMLDD